MRDDSSPGGPLFLLKGAAVDLASSLALGLSVLLLAFPFLLRRLVHGDSERYEWVISGPPPFDQFGSGPFQLALYVGSWTLAVGLLATALAMRRRLAVGVWTPGTFTLAAVGLAVALLAFLGLAALL